MIRLQGRYFGDILILSWKEIIFRISSFSWLQTIATNSGRFKQGKNLLERCLGSSDSLGKVESHNDKTGRNRASEV